MAKPYQTYEVVAYYQDQKGLKIKARSREEAIQKASKRCADLGLTPITLEVPFLGGDE